MGGSKLGLEGFCPGTNKNVQRKLGVFVLYLILNTSSILDDPLLRIPTLAQGAGEKKGTRDKEDVLFFCFCEHRVKRVVRIKVRFEDRGNFFIRFGDVKKRKWVYCFAVHDFKTRKCDAISDGNNLF